MTPVAIPASANKAFSSITDSDGGGAEKEDIQHLLKRSEIN